MEVIIIEGPHSERVKRDAQARIIQMIQRNLLQMNKDEGGTDNGRRRACTS